MRRSRNQLLKLLSLGALLLGSMGLQGCALADLFLGPGAGAGASAPVGGSPFAGSPIGAGPQLGANLANLGQTLGAGVQSSTPAPVSGLSLPPTQSGFQNPTPFRLPGLNPVPSAGGLAPTPGYSAPKAPQAPVIRQQFSNLNQAIANDKVNEALRQAPPEKLDNLMPEDNLRLPFPDEGVRLLAYQGPESGPTA